MLLDEIKERELEGQVNLIVFSDHGMTTIDILHKINISAALNMGDIKTISDASTQVFIWPHDGREKKVTTLDGCVTICKMINVSDMNSEDPDQIARPQYWTVGIANHPINTNVLSASTQG